MSKTTTFLTPILYQYLKDVSLREHPVLTELRKETSKLAMSQMQIAPEQGQFMALLIEILNAKKTLEIGVFTGYSALSVALALPEDGKIIACDINEEWTTLAKEFWQKAGVAHKIELKIAPANDTLDNLIANGAAESFDFAFIDADKAGYDSYYEKCLVLVRQGGLILIDNTLWDGAVADANDHHANTEAIRKFNAKLHIDERVSLSLVAIGDGVTIARKR